MRALRTPNQVRGWNARRAGDLQRLRNAALALASLGRVVNDPLGWITILASILITSTSNSPGRKSPDLFFRTASRIAMTGYARTAPAAVRRHVATRFGRGIRRFGLSTSPLNLAGLKP